MSHDLSIRPLRTPEEYEACVALQRATWGDDFRELVPPALLQVSQKIGGIVAGAFAEDRLIGFVFGLTGPREGTLAHWSHMLAVEAGHRDQGLGRALKHYQREQVAAAGVSRMYWTFDPLVARNAHLNLHHLGARVVEYVRDMYGNSSRSRTDSVIGSDRFVVQWDLVAAGIEGSRDRAIEGSAERGTEGAIVHSESAALPDAAVVRVAVPPDIQALKTQDPAAALAWRAATRRAFEHYFARGYVVAGFERRGRDSVAYRLERRP
jgi:predicted GNAT superfamily acetyltransferase